MTCTGATGRDAAHHGGTPHRGAHAHSQARRCGARLLPKTVTTCSFVSATPLRHPCLPVSSSQQVLQRHHALLYKRTTTCPCVGLHASKPSSTSSDMLFDMASPAVMGLHRPSDAELSSPWNGLLSRVSTPTCLAAHAGDAVWHLPARALHRLSGGASGPSHQHLPGRAVCGARQALLPEPQRV